MRKGVSRMRIRKALSLLAALALCLPLLSGCHGNVERAAFSVPDHFDDSQPIEIVFWAKNDTNKTQTDIYRAAIAGFEALYPNVKVTLRLYTDYGQIYNDVITNISTDTTPNVCITYPDHIATYLTGRQVVVPLEELASDERFGLGGSEVRFDAPTKEEIVPRFLEECRIGGQLYAMPFMRSTEALYINQDYVEALGYGLPDVLTWDFIWEVSERAMAQDSDGNFLLNGQKVMVPFIYKSTDNMMISMLKQKGAPYSTESGEILLFNETTGELLREIYTHAATRAFSTFKISSYPGNFLNAGQCVFALDSTAGATWMGSDAPLMDIHSNQVVQFRTAVRPIPQFDPDHPQMISQGPSICIFSRENEQEVLASWLFVQYLLSNEIQTAYAETEGYLPVTLKAQQSPQYQDYLSRKGEDNKEHYGVKIEASELLMRYTDDTFVTPVFNGRASLRSAAGQLIENTCKSARRGEEMNDAYLEKLYGDVTSLFRLDQIDGRQTAREIPTGSIILLAVIPAVWAVIIAVRIRRRIRMKAAEKA